MQIITSTLMRPFFLQETPKEPEEPEVKLEGEELLAALKKQLEYYFSRENVSKDAYLVSQMDAQMFVQIAVIQQFAKIKKLTEDTELICAAVTESKICIVNADKSAIKPAIKAERSTIILRDIPSDTKEEDVRAIFEGSGEVKSVRSDVGDTWFVTMATEQEAVSTLLKIRTSGKKFNDKPIAARLKSENILRSFYPAPGTEAGAVPGANGMYNPRSPQGYYPNSPGGAMGGFFGPQGFSGGVNNYGYGPPQGAGKGGGFYGGKGTGPMGYGPMDGYGYAPSEGAKGRYENREMAANDRGKGRQPARTRPTEGKGKGGEREGRKAGQGQGGQISQGGQPNQRGQPREAGQRNAKGKQAYAQGQPSRDTAAQRNLLTSANFPPLGGSSAGGNTQAQTKPGYDGKFTKYSTVRTPLGVCIRTCIPWPLMYFFTIIPV
jgi:hypothetical protein